MMAVYDYSYLNMLSQFLARVPIFLCGMYFAPLVKNNYQLPANKINVICLFCGFISFVVEVCLASMGRDYAYSFTGRFFYAPLAIFIIYIVSRLRLTESNCKNNNIIEKFVLWSGGITLEIYLLNQRTIAVVESIMKYWGLPLTTTQLVVANLLGLILCYLLAVFINRLNTMILKIINTK